MARIDLSREQKWTLLSAGSALVAGLAVRTAIKLGWQALREEEPPLNPLAPESTWKDAVLFSAATGLVAGLARLLVRRAATSAWAEAKGFSPPGLRRPKR